MLTCDVLIIGAGAAGMMCAIEAGKRHRKVILLDHSERIGRKILISGGGRCNFTNMNAGPTNFVSQNAHFCKSALARYTANDFIALVKKHHIKFHEKKLGQLFCDRSAQEIVDLLVKECEQAGTKFVLGSKIEAIDKSERFSVRTTNNVYRSDALVIATGGLSIPQIGATGFGYDIARQFGLKIITPAPALDGFNFNQEDLHRFASLSGVSIDSLVSCNKASFRENILFTHTGLSGPASLQASLYWQKSAPLQINLLPETNALSWLTTMRIEKAKVLIKNVLSELLPKRFAEQFCEYFSFHSNLAELSENRLNQLANTLENWEIFPKDTVGYKKAEVTKGGVDTNELSSKTMEAKKVPGLYFIGEVVDVTGQLGGYNFQWAWSSGFAAGQSV
jgi:predicted Rossmann fold flavoprotein